MYKKGFFFRQENYPCNKEVSSRVASIALARVSVSTVISGLQLIRNGEPNSKWLPSPTLIYSHLAAAAPALGSLCMPAPCRHFFTGPTRARAAAFRAILSCIRVGSSFWKACLMPVKMRTCPPWLCIARKTKTKKRKHKVSNSKD